MFRIILFKNQFSEGMYIIGRIVYNLKFPYAKAILDTSLLGRSSCAYLKKY